MVLVQKIFKTHAYTNMKQRSESHVLIAGFDGAKDKKKEANENPGESMKHHVKNTRTRPKNKDSGDSGENFVCST